MNSFTVSLFLIYLTYNNALLYPLNPRAAINRLQMTSDEGYGPVGSLLRQGPVPFFIRITKPDTYDAAVKKYQALEKCDKITAQANMDAYFQDPNGWAANKIRSRQTGIELDYANANMDQKSLILTSIWSTLLLTLSWRIFSVQVLHQN